MPEPAEAAGDPGDKMAALRLAIGSRGINIEYDDNLGSALGLSCGGRIRVMCGLPPASEFAVLAHEFAHLCAAVGYVRPDALF